MAFLTLTSKKKAPRELDQIVESFNSQLNELDERVKYDQEQIEIKKQMAQQLLDETATLEKNVERSNRIKTRFMELIN